MRKRFAAARLWIAVLLLFSLTACQKSATPPTAPATDWRAPDPAAPGGFWAQTVAPEGMPTLKQEAKAPRVHLEATYHQDSRFLEGTERMLFTNETERPLNTFYLRTFARVWGDGAPEDNLQLKNLQVNGKPAKFTLGQTLIAIPLQPPLAPGGQMEVSFEAQVLLPWVPLSRTLELTTNLGTYGISGAATAFQAFAAPLRNGEEGHEVDWPPVLSMESPPFETHTPVLGDFSLTLPANWLLAGTGVQVGERTVRENQQTVRFAGLVSDGPIIIGSPSWQSQRVDAGSIRINVFTTKLEGDAEWARLVAEEVKLALTTEIALLGPMPQREIDVVTLPLPLTVNGVSVGGGLVMLATGLTSSEATARQPGAGMPEPVKALALGGKLERREAVAHELSHIWWGGGAVQLNTERSPWYIEALASATAIDVVGRVWGPESGEALRQHDITLFKAARLGGTPDYALGGPGGDGQSLTQAQCLIYYKGALFLDQVRQAVGDQRYYAALRDYLERSPLGQSDGTRGVLTDLMPDPKVAALYQHWVKEAHFDEDYGTLDVTSLTIRK